jgi:nicotinate-nucleotide pyrophosphorylase (carboxylating)
VSVWLQPEPANWWHVVDDAIEEDVGSGDVTGGCVDPELLVDWHIEAQADGVLSGIGIVEYLLSPYATDSEESRLALNKADGERIQRGDRLAEGRTQARRVLLAERTVLNFLMHLSGVATLTAAFVGKVEGTNAKILDTRKTIPGLRGLQKYAVRCGGGHNHRMGLFDGALIKDNHIAACGSIGRAVERVRSYASHMVRIEVECRSIEQVEEAIEAGADIVLLDNMDPFMMRDAVKRFKGDAMFEASGGVNLDTVRGMAQTGVDFISIGALTHSAPALMLHMEFD